MFLRSVIRFSFLLVSPFLSPLPLLFICSLSSSTVRLSFAGGSLPLVSTCSPSSPTPSSACCLFDLRLSFFCSGLPPLPFLSFLSDSSPLAIALVLSLSFSCLFSVLGGAATGLPRSFGSHSLVVFSSYAPASFFMRQSGGLGGGGFPPVLFVFCESEGGYSDVCLFHPPGCLLSLFILFLVFLCCSVFALLSSIALVSCACLPAPVFLFMVVRCLSDCRVALLSLFSRRPVHSCLFSFHLEFVLFLYVPTLPPPCITPLSCLFFRSPVFFFSFLSSLLARVCLSSLFPLLLFLRCSGSALRKLCVSGCAFLFCSASAFSGFCFHCFGVLASVLFSPVGLLLHGVTVSVVACRLLRRFFATRRCSLWLLALSFFFSPSFSAFLCVVPLHFSSVFLSSLV